MESVSTSDIEAYVDQCLESIQKRPGMFGPPVVNEFGCHQLVVMYAGFCLKDWAITAPAGHHFQSFAKKQLPKRPGPMTLSQWFTDPVYGEPAGSDHAAGEAIASFYIRYKAHLKNGNRV